MASRPASHRTRPPLGQHFLRDRAVLAREIAYAELQGDETVLEIGPGPGVLTEALLGVAGRVVAIEKDRRFQASLEGLARRCIHVFFLRLTCGYRIAYPVFVRR